ncbi:MAG: hypothetical protein AB7F19_05355 [Candidatus Babeliales bacterium]
MKKLPFLIIAMSCTYQSSLQADQVLQQNLVDLTRALQTLQQRLPRNGTKRPLPKGPAQLVSEEEKNQLIAILKDLNLEKQATVDDTQEVTQADFLKDLKLTLDEILKGFNAKTHAYVGYPNYKNEFLKRHLGDFDVALKLLKAATPQDARIPYYESWRPHLEKAVGTLPVK